jgi:glycosyltransferase involved in cell wall biosynthesis
MTTDIEAATYRPERDGGALESAGGLRFAFVIEQTLGHVAHTRNIERALLARPDIEPTFVKLGFESGGVLRRLPGAGSWSVRASWSARSALRRRLAAGKLDAAFIHTQVASLLAGSVMRRVPTVVSLDATPINYDSVAEAYGHRRRGRLAEWAKLRINRHALGGARALIAFCAWARDSLVADYSIPAERITVIHPGVDLSLFRPARHRRPGPPRILFVGGDFERKGGGDLLDAMAGLPGPVELDLVTGTPPSGLKGRPGVRVHRGLRPQSQPLIELYRQADIFALPSRGDCFPQAVAEAMACGLPLVATDVGGVSGMVENAVTGYLVPPRAPADLGRALARLVWNPELCRLMGSEGLAVAVREHDASRNCNRIFDLMREVAATSTGTVPAGPQ